MGFQDILVIIIAKVQFKYIFTFVVAILKTGVKPRFSMSLVLNSVFFINRVRVLWGQVRLFSKVSPRVESGFFSSPGFVRVRVRVRSGFRSMPSQSD